MTGYKSAPPRVRPVQNADPEQFEALSKTPTHPDGRHFNVFRMLANHPRLLKRFNVLAGAFQRGVLPAADRELVILRVSARCGGEYEFQQHVPTALREGLTQGDIERLSRNAAASCWHGGERGLIQFTDELLAHDDVTDAAWDGVPYSNRADAMVELVCLIGFYRMASSLTNATRTQLEPARITGGSA